MAIENVIYRGVPEASSGGPLAPDGTVIHAEIHLRRGDGSLLRLANVSMSAGVDMVLDHALARDEAVEIWAKSPGAGEVNWCYAARTASLEVYQPNGVVEAFRDQGVRLVAWGLFCAVAVGTVVLSPLALLSPFLWLAAAALFRKASDAAPLPEEAFLRGAP